jgi:Phage integrase family.
MSKLNDTGVYQLSNGKWAYRYAVMVNGVRKEARKTKDAFGKPLNTKTSAAKARQTAIELELNTDKLNSAPIIRKTVAEVFQEYCDKGRSGKAYQTIRKQDSIWNNHISIKFGKRYIDGISAAEVIDYLTELYYTEGRAYRYVESFLKMFYLVFGQAYSRNYLDVDIYSKLCINKDTKIHMPKLKTDDDTDIVAFSKEELAVLDDYFHGAKAETAYLLGRYCGLRINECYGLKWENVDLKNGTILIDRQMQYQESLIKLVSLKTRNAKRTIYMCDKLQAHFVELAHRLGREQIEFAALREQNQRMITDLDGKKISSTELVNCLYDGKIQTVNSMKYPTREIKSKFKIDFKYHYLRHTYGTLMAEKNTPTHLLCNQMGHGNIQVTQAYYIAMSKTGIEILQSNLNQL